MYLESADFLIRDRKDSDQDIIIKIETSMPWMKPFSEKVEEETYRKTILDRISKDEHYWIIERKNGEPLGSLSFDIDSDLEAHIYIHPIENVDMSGFGTQLLNKAVEYLNREFRIETIYAGLWDKNDPSIPLYKEADYEVEDGNLEINL